MESQKLEEKNKSTFKDNWFRGKPVLFIGGLATMTLAFMSYFAYKNFEAGKTETFGQLGDFLGGVLNPIFALFSFLALLYVIHLQKEELGITREELEHSREELKKSSIALQGQEKLLRQQQIESTLFRLVEIKNNVLNLKPRNIVYGKDGSKLIVPLSGLLPPVADNIVELDNDIELLDLLKRYSSILISILKLTNNLEKISQDIYYLEIVLTYFSRNELVFLRYIIFDNPSIVEEKDREFLKDFYVKTKIDQRIAL